MRKSQKKSRGFSYIEVIIALALFAIAMLAIIPALSQAGRNMIFAQETYASHLQAQRIMLATRDALADGNNPVESAILNSDGLEFSIWVSGWHNLEFHSTVIPDASAVVTGLNPTMNSQASTIVAVVWGDEGQIAGRAIGMLYP